MEVQIISKEDIKPSSPTPQHLTTFKLSFLDQFIPTPYAPVILFYPANDSSSNLDHINKKLALLKNSLSETLALFYPLGGKFSDDLFIDCNDEGAYFVETRVNCFLDELLRQPDLLFLHRLLPRDFFPKESSEATYVSNIQVNVFQCGGIAIGVCISHKILDGAALSSFLKAWAAAARGDGEEMICPNFAATSLFPANDLWLRDSSMVMWGSMYKKGKSITKRFVFDASAIAEIKARAISSRVTVPTRVEAVSAFIWKCFMAVSKAKHGSQRPSLLTHLVNLRRRMSPPLSKNSVGNFLWIAAAKCVSMQKVELPYLVNELRDAISKLDSDFVKKLRSDVGNSVMCESLKEINEICSKDEVDYIGFTSWCKFGFYETDFGWGKPIWVSGFGLNCSPVMNLIILVDTRFGDGIEAWTTLEEEEMAMLERNAEFIKFASMDPSPLLIGNPNPVS
ncbi:vinorine synthase-like [Melia azedarach]|uniref:Vinorine synthase-like n=1 Tax=Melia azedarach TaxID=155640 RepID=A0ACC1WST1_MELAZ|nr:vinorine synthase-like [Melia azedarach]